MGFNGALAGQSAGTTRLISREKLKYEFTTVLRYSQPVIVP
ncbi:hypothetical protein Pyrfu_0417 [Pyrolobus fumarii 1A]|uniref:Uncharacterized protein n=1 Tax=Pyrolobus fumarii (strain DSM 11204 / 1A) TaxID=694429 RepID=G0EG40_PYRF1|nr:hypothetical protein Pyrfu_0417 [Pyrolobus fumarii 1A]